MCAETAAPCGGRENTRPRERKIESARRTDDQRRRRRMRSGGSMNALRISFVLVVIAACAPAAPAADPSTAPAATFQADPTTPPEPVATPKKKPASPDGQEIPAKPAGPS